MDKAVERQTEKLENVANLTGSEADKIIRLHKAQMADYNGTISKHHGWQHFMPPNRLHKAIDIIPI